MKGLIKAKSVKVFTTSDGKDFDDKAEASRHQAKLNLRSWFMTDTDEPTAVLLVDSIVGNLDGFREIIAPMLRKPRAPKMVETETKKAA